MKNPERIVTRKSAAAIIPPGYVEYGGDTTLGPKSDDLNFQPSHPFGPPRPDARNTEASLEQVREMLDQTRNHLIRTQRRIERNERNAETLGRHIMALWVLVVMAIVGLGLLTWYQVVLMRTP